ncbi:MAG: hypothetical protein D6690_05175 [Nitrospirae bacterium]|nr:MAG: hypothetical protein D6690_05175 [Nitrospirota bacterium]
MRLTRQRLIRLVASLVLVGGSPSPAVFSACEGLTGMDAANCALGTIQSQGLTDPGTIGGYQSQVPQYGGTAGCQDAGCAGASESGYYQNVGQMNTDAGAAMGSDPMTPQMTQQELDKNSWAPSIPTSAPVQTANNVTASLEANPPPPPTSSTCTTVEVCIDETVTTNTVICQSPGTATAFCQIIVDTVLTSDAATGFSGASTGWCTNHWLDMRVRKIADFQFAVDWRERDSGEHDCTGNQWNLIGIITIPGIALGPNKSILHESFSVNFTGTDNGGCQPWVLNSLAYGQGDVFVKLCPEGKPPVQTGTVTLTSWSYSVIIREDLWSDNCAPYRTDGVQVSTTCLDSAPRTLPDGNGGSHTVNPPSAFPALGCWTRSEEWIYTASHADTCGPYVSDPTCQQASSTCLIETNGRCELYEKTYECGSTTTCAQKQTIQQCTNCGDPNGLMPFCLDMSTPPNPNLFIAGTYLQLVEDIEDEFDENTLRIFPGQRLACDYSTIAPPLIDCCDSSDPSKLFGSCSQEEIELAEARKANLTHFVGTRCVDKIFGICIRKEDVYCKFGTKLSRIVQEQGRPQVGRSWGGADTPDCEGFTIVEFQALNFEAMNLSEFYADVQTNLDVSAIMSAMNTKICATVGC